MKHIHICGPPRSGTTLLMELMRSCFVWDWAPETETTMLVLSRHQSGRCLTKKPLEGNYARCFLRDPHKWLIYCQRDPRDIVCSRHGKVPDRYWANLRMWRNLRCKIAKLSANPRLIVVRYEELVRNPNKMQQTLCEQIPWLKQTALFADYQKHSNPSSQSLRAMRGARRVNTLSIGRWHQHLPRLAGQILQHGPITKELIEDGYEKDEAWIKELADIEPDLSPSRWPDHLSLRQSIKNKRKEGTVLVKYVLCPLIEKFRIGA